MKIAGMTEEPSPSDLSEDVVDHLLDDWGRERPDLELARAENLDHAGVGPTRRCIDPLTTETPGCKRPSHHEDADDCDNCHATWRHPGRFIRQGLAA